MQRSLRLMAIRASSPSLLRASVCMAPRMVSAPTTRFFSVSPMKFNAKKDETSNGKEESAEPAEKDATSELSEVDQLKAKLAEKDQEVTLLKDRYLRSVADFRNLQETTKREIQKARDFALQKFARDLLESLDNFGHALSAVKDETLAANKEVSQLYDGVEMTKNIFEKTLVRHGISKIDPVDERFDPNRHEATFEVPQPDKEPGTVFHVQQPGYELNGRVLRAAKVGVVKGTE
ncbi:BA75_00793T0 [Komagataella pastoris]|uniref:GrpE protein homolog n=1 Tax=Komagataella pastoris TaxID=4922 RepID=A0A1B2J8Z7_PICPA|nr:BA75_00793T0 [Komagataella pastoris]